LAVLATISIINQADGNKMKTQRVWLLLGGLLVLAFLAYYLTRQRATMQKRISNATHEARPTSGSKTVVYTNALSRNPTMAQPAIPASTNPTPTINDRQRTNEIRQYIESQNKPIEFYGLVIDQSSNPISGAKVRVEVRQKKVIVPAPWGDKDQVVPIGKETDSDGRFEITGVTGDSLTIRSVEKEGYKLSPKTENIYGYGGVPKPFHPDPQGPIIIKMWKLGEPANLISHRTLFGFQPDGRIYTLDLIGDSKMVGASLNGDLQIRFQRPLELKPKEIYDWTLDIFVVNGGLIETTDEFEYLAPENGYQPQISFQTNSVSPKAMPDITKDYYFNSRNGQVYGVVSLQIFSDYNGQSAILVDSRINPNGLRNLQP
jgi:hypothetical protein